MYCFRKSKIADISASLKVVNIAVSFLAATNRSATLRRSKDIFLRVTCRSPVGVPIDGTAWIASSLVIRPFRPDPVIVALSIPFSSMIFFAAGEGEPEA